MFETLDAHVVVDQTINVDDDGAGLYVEQQKRRRRRSGGAREKRECAGGRARIDEEGAVTFARFEAVRVPCDEHVDVELSL